MRWPSFHQSLLTRSFPVKSTSFFFALDLYTIDMRMLSDRVLIKDREPETLAKTKTGLYVVDTRKDYNKTLEGDVLAIGPDVKYIKKGDVVTYLGTGGIPLSLEETASGKIVTRIMKESDVLAINDEEDHLS